MRGLFVILIFSIFTFACNESAQPSQAKDSDSVLTDDNSSTFISVLNSVQHVDIPVLVPESLGVDRGYTRCRLNEVACDNLLPADFEFSSYTSVSCFGESSIGNVPVLWFELFSDGAYEESPDARDMLMVMYDCNYKPIDVYNVAGSDLGYSISYVRSDSVFTMYVDEMENVNVTVTELAITEKGFVAGSSETHEFDAEEKGQQESLDFKNQYFSKRGVTTVWKY